MSVRRDGRSHVKGRAKGVGQRFIKGGRIVNDVPLERVFYTKAH